MITVEIKGAKGVAIAEVAICCDEQGLEILLEKLLYLRNKKDHIHFMTPAWAGNELSEIKQGGEDYSLVNHLRFVKL
ncbi:MAG: hypothetical protein CXR30_16420 [Geobacter sp.]|nr:MAG: hypothetical protein CXR30_16420 [Geobacter sp.]